MADDPRVYRTTEAYAEGERLDRNDADVQSALRYAASHRRPEWEKGWALVEWPYGECFYCFWPGAEGRRFILATLTDYTHYEDITAQHTNKGRRRRRIADYAIEAYKVYESRPYKVHLKGMDDDAYDVRFASLEDAQALFEAFLKTPTPDLIHSTRWDWAN